MRGIGGATTPTFPPNGQGIGNLLGARTVAPHANGVFARFFKKTPQAVTEEITFKQRAEAFWTWYTGVADRFYPTIEAGKCGGPASRQSHFGRVSLLGASHLVVEVGCAYSLTRLLDAGSVGLGTVFAYNAIAFCGQPLLGWIVDRWRLDRIAAIGGCLLVMAGIAALNGTPWLTVVLIAVGNAWFHVGAGSQCIVLARGRASGLGIFVGPGAIGLVAGKQLAYLGSSGVAAGLCLAQALVVVGLMRLRDRDDASINQGARPDRTRSILIGCMILVCIALRSLIGSQLDFSWNRTALLAMLLAGALAMGKLVGGFLVDRFGWLAVSTAAVLVAVPVLHIGDTAVIAGVVGMALFQIPMAVTLGVLAAVLPTRPALAFGIASAAIFFGSYAGAGVQPESLHSIGVLAGSSGATLVFLAVALTLSGHAGLPLTWHHSRRNSV